MVPLNLAIPGHLIRFVACHWTSFEEASDTRRRLADFLRRDTYEYLNPEQPSPGLTRHVLILGDLNEEPTSPLFEKLFLGSRDRAASRRSHWQDAEVRRVRLYNAAWRYLGEQVAHGGAGTASGVAGTFYNDTLRWRTFDHLLVSGELLGAAPPYLDESRTRIVTTPAMKDEDGLPRPFTPDSGSGISDHLPIVGRLVLPEAAK
jgi:endonuclease/exonuclease/phosphatase family metal-dependent hydrolase